MRHRILGERFDLRYVSLTYLLCSLNRLGCIHTQYGNATDDVRAAEKYKHERVPESPGHAKRRKQGNHG